MVVYLLVLDHYWYKIITIKLYRHIYLNQNKILLQIIIATIVDAYYDDQLINWV